MSDMAEKLERRPEVAGAHARATLKQLKARWGCAEVTALTPDEVIVECMGTREVWRHLSGSGATASYQRAE